MEPVQLDIFGMTGQDQPPLVKEDNSSVKGTGDPLHHNRDPTPQGSVNQRGNSESGLSARQTALAKSLYEKSINLRKKPIPPTKPEP